MPTVHAPRLPGFDYSTPGAYLVTICTWRRTRCLGKLTDAGVALTEVGGIVAEELAQTATARKDVVVDSSVVMPDHFHAIMLLGSITDRTDNTTRSDLRRIIGGIKAASTSRWRRVRNDPAARLWQASFHERALRSEHALNACRRYVLENPIRTWHRYHP